MGRRKGKVGMVFQHFNLFPHMSALHNVMEAPPRVLRLPRAEAEARARERLSAVGLADKADAYPAHLSGGQKQRVEIARGGSSTRYWGPKPDARVLMCARMLSTKGDREILFYSICCINHAPPRCRPATNPAFCRITEMSLTI